MYFLKRYPDFRTIFTVIRCYSIARKSHYDVLNLRRNCTDKEIKQAFIKMSKEYHPDINKDSKAQEQFIRVTEAYNTLSKPGSRAQYDRSQMDPGLYHPHVYRSYETYGYRKSTRSEQYTDSSRTQKNREGPAEQSYYGVKGLKKVPNVYIIILCFGIAFVGTFMQVFVIREMYVVQRQQSLQRSKLLAEELDRVRAAAKSNPNEVHTRLLLERIVGAANPTVATASMGQALATDKKIPPEHSDSRTPTADGDQDPSDLRESVVEPLLTEYGIQVVQTDELDLVYSATPKMKKAVTFMDLVHTRLLLERIVGAANPTVATASMGQALATDKKIPPEHSDSRTPTADGDQDPSDLRESVVEPLLTEYGIQVVQTDELDLVYSATPKMKKAVTFMDLVRSFVNSYYRDP